MKTSKISEILDDEERMWELDGTLSEPERVAEFARLTLRHNSGISGPVEESDIRRAVKERMSYELARKLVVWPPDMVREGQTYRGSGGDKVDKQHLPSDRRPFMVEVFNPDLKVRKRSTLEINLFHGTSFKEFP
jgi:hypothetical protein